MNEIIESTSRAPWRAAFPTWAGRLQFRPGSVSLVWGDAGHWKTTLMAQAWAGAAIEDDLVVTVATQDVYPIWPRMIHQTMYGRSERELTDAELEKAYEFAERKFYWAVTDREASAKWLLEKAEIAASPYGSAVFVIDGWEALAGASFPTAKQLAALKELSRRSGMHIQVILESAEADGRWQNWCDLGIAVHHVCGSRVVVGVRKSVYDAPAALTVELNIGRGLFEEVE